MLYNGGESGGKKEMLLGPIVNSLLVVGGSLLGILMGRYIRRDVEQTVFTCLGLTVVYIAVSSLLKPVSAVNVLLSMALGGLIGGWLDLDSRVRRFAERLQKRFAAKDDRFARGFAASSILFCTGSMAIIGALESGLQNVHTTLITKGIIDGITAIFFAAENGIGVIFSSLVLLIYQGGMALASSLLSPIITEACLSQISVVGGIILLSVGLGMLKIGDFKSMNYTPAIIITVILTLLGI
ncbi:MAG: DUF554 domain-containing protein [Erysipelotrichaceae bacterium]|nr:DUF554 domain-containing protein [Erysipelotrichaceae bacterium]